MAALLDVKERLFIPEQMDDPGLDAGAHEQALRGLAHLNTLSLADQPIWSEIRSLLREKGDDPLRVLDVATGAGDFPVKLAQRAGRLGLPIQADGCDVSEQAVEIAKRRAEREQAQVRFFNLNVTQDPFPNQYDVIVSSLFLHHLSEDDAVRFMQKAKEATRKVLILSDLIRSSRGLFLAFAASRLFTRSSVIHFDAPQSVRAAYTLDEIRRLADWAGLHEAKIKRVWPCRFLIVWKKP